jgi:cell wall-associated NlpC family hydrolase
MPETLLVAQPVLPLFAEPDPYTEQVSQALLGAVAEVLETRSGYHRVRTPDAYEGWAEATGFAAAPAGWAGPWSEIEDLWVNFRAIADSQAASVTQAFIGCRFPRLEETERFVQLLLPDGRRLWTETHRTRPVAETPLRPLHAASVCATARRFLKVPYLWGGSSPWGLDCSGFVQLVLRLHGVLIQRDAGQQFRQGRALAAGAAADLVFFGPDHRPERITHVGMLLDERRFIHALGNACVRVDLLHAPRWKALHRGTRRFVER